MASTTSVIDHEFQNELCETGFNPLQNVEEGDVDDDGKSKRTGMFCLFSFCHVFNLFFSMYRLTFILFFNISPVIKLISFLL